MRGKELAMHTAVMTCDFLLAPARCIAEEIETRVSDLAAYAQSTQIHGIRPLLERDAVERMIDAGNYPSDGLFKKNLAKVEEPIYAVKDVCRVVSSILDNAEYFLYSDRRLWDIENAKLDPEFCGLTPARKKEIFELIEEVAVCNELESLQFSILHYCDKNIFPEVEFGGTFKEIVPFVEGRVPSAFLKKVKLFNGYKNYLTFLNVQDLLLNDPENLDLIKECLYLGSLCALKSRGVPLDYIDLDSFNIGPYFVESLKMNQCLPGQNFWGACFSSIIAVLTCDAAYEVNIFRKSEKSDEQRVAGKYRAFRCHVTKGTVGLRLMFWKCDEGKITLANVGPKHEEEIRSPD